MFTIVDGVVAVVLLGSAGMAFMRGFVHEVLAIAAWIGAGMAAYYGFPFVQPWFRAQIGVAWMADIIAALSLFLVALLALSLVTKAVSNRVKRSALNSVDSSLGFVFGLLRGAVVLCLAYMLAAWLIAPDTPPQWLAAAKTRPWLERGASLLQGLRPAGFGQGEKKASDERGATGDLEEDSRRARDLAETLIAAPAPAAEAAPAAITGETAAAPPSKPARPAGYDTQQRREMDRLFQGNQR